jgi:hypothetical protein
MKYYTPWPPNSPDEIYIESMTVIAKDGSLMHASAGGCNWGREFFSMSDVECEYFDNAWERHFGRLK